MPRKTRWGRRKEDNQAYPKTRRGLYGKPRHAKLAEIVKLDTPSNARASAETLLKNFNATSDRNKKRQIKQATVQAANRAMVQSKNNKIRWYEREEAEKVFEIYKNAYKHMDVNDWEHKSEKTLLIALAKQDAKLDRSREKEKALNEKHRNGQITQNAFETQSKKCVDEYERDMDERGFIYRSLLNNYPNALKENGHEKRYFPQVDKSMTKEELSRTLKTFGQEGRTDEVWENYSSTKKSVFKILKSKKEKRAEKAMVKDEGEGEKKYMAMAVQADKEGRHGDAEVFRQHAQDEKRHKTEDIQILNGKVVKP